MGRDGGKSQTKNGRFSTAFAPFALFRPQGPGWKTSLRGRRRLNQIDENFCKFLTIGPETKIAFSSNWSYLPATEADISCKLRT